MNQDVKYLTDTSYKAHLVYLMDRIHGVKRRLGFFTAACMLLELETAPDSEAYFDSFYAFTSMGFNEEMMKGAIEAKNLHFDIYSRLNNHFKGRSDWPMWIQKL